ncbi:MAG TPA: cytochrome c oxidase assembly protein, partial [Steroidobacteraceae bacterium]
AAHMTQHLLLIAAIPPLLIAGAPQIAWAWLGTGTFAQRLPQPVRDACRRVSAPVPAFAAHTATLWGWHARVPYEAALRNPALHALEHATLLGTALLLWSAALRPSGVRRNGQAVGIILLLATAMQSGALGALLAMSRTTWYGIGSDAASAWGLTPLADQQLAGLIMWIPGGMLYTVAACGLFLAWIGPVHVRISAAAAAAATQ